MRDDSENKILYLNYFIRSVVENKFFRNLPIVIIFLILDLDRWIKTRKERYGKEKENKTIESIPYLGFYDLKINSVVTFKTSKIPSEINEKNNSFNQLNKSQDELFLLMEKMNKYLNNTSHCFFDLKNQHLN